MKQLNRLEIQNNQTNPIKILQFGEGNFLRAFTGWMIDVMNQAGDFKAGVAVVQPIQNGMLQMLANQDGLYHHLMRGLKNGEQINETRLVSCIEKTINPFEQLADYFEQAKNEELKIVISNTTESGIEFKEDDQPDEGKLAQTFPGKLTQLLKVRYDHFSGSKSSGLVFLPCELIDKNGEHLRNAILNYAELWRFDEGFTDWIEKYHHFGNTLVDRIVAGYPREEIEEIKNKIGFDDQLVVASEIFHLFVIEGSNEIQKAFPADKYGLNVKFVNDLKPYRIQKVRILNGTHTAMVPVGLLLGIATVRESVEDNLVGTFIAKVMNEEIVGTINLPESETNQFANEVLERFKNPFIKHELKSIALNSISKFRVRILPTMLDYISTNGEPPKYLTYALVCLIKLYLSDNFEVSDDDQVEAFFEKLKADELPNNEMVQLILSRKDFWGMDLNQIDSLNTILANYLNSIDTEGHAKTLKRLLARSY